MTAYWLTFSLLSFLAFTSKIRKVRVEGYFRENFDLLTLALATFFIVFIGLRFNVGGDWINYLNIYLEAKDDTISFNLAGDPGFHFLNWLSYKVGIGYHGVNVLSAIIFVYGLFRFCRYLPRPYLALLISFPYLITVVGMGYQRQSIAIGITMIALIKIFRQEYIRFFILVMLAATFHKSAIIFFPLLVFTTSKNRILILVTSLICLIAGYYIFVESRFVHFMEHYISAQQESSGALIRVLMLILPSMLFFLLKDRLVLKDSERRLWNIFGLSSFVLLLSLFAMNISTTVDRFALYLLPIQLFMFAHLSDIFHMKYKPLINFLIIIYSALIFFIWSFFANHSNHWIPYDNAIYRLIIQEPTFFGV